MLAQHPGPFVRGHFQQGKIDDGAVDDRCVADAGDGDEALLSISKRLSLPDGGADPDDVEAPAILT